MKFLLNGLSNSATVIHSVIATSILNHGTVIIPPSGVPSAVVQVIPSRLSITTVRQAHPSQSSNAFRTAVFPSGVNQTSLNVRKRGTLRIKHTAGSNRIKSQYYSTSRHWNVLTLYVPRAPSQLRKRSHDQ
jgi:dipeptidase